MHSYTTRTHRQTPVHAQVDRNEHIVLGEDVNVAALRPALDARVTVAHELRVEERVEGVHRRLVVAVAALHQHVHVEVYHLHTCTCTHDHDVTVLK